MFHNRKMLQHTYSVTEALAKVCGMIKREVNVPTIAAQLQCRPHSKCKYKRSSPGHTCRIENKDAKRLYEAENGVCEGIVRIAYYIMPSCSFQNRVCEGILIA